MKTKVTVQSLTEELDAIARGAVAAEQYGAAKGAVETKAKLHGHLVDRKEVGAPGEFATLSADQVLEQVRKDHGDDAANAFARLIGASELEQAVEAEQPVDIPVPASSSVN